MSMQKRDIKKEITDQIITMIEAAQKGNGDWTKPFRSLAKRPTNAVTNNPYRGLNSLWLSMVGFGTVATYKQWQGLGYQVQKGSASVPITVPMIGKDKKTGDSVMFGFRAASVFSCSQVLNIETNEPWIDAELPEIDLTERLKNADKYIKNLGFDVRHSCEGGAYYSPASDFINMPNRGLFVATKTSTATENYYSTLFHESAHCTGHKSRLNRLELKNKKGYAFEELIAELSAAFLCTELQVSSSPREDHAQYLASWLKALSNDNDYIFKAASEAQKVFDWMNAAQAEISINKAA